MSHIRISSILAGAFLMFAMPVCAQAATYTYVNQRAPYNNPGTLAALNLPKVGKTFQVQVPRSYQSWPWCCYGTNHYLAIGAKNPNVAIPALGGFLFTSADVVLRTPNLTNWQQPLATMSFKIPNSPQLVGVRFYQQVLSESYGEFVPSTYSLSRGGYGVIGK